MERNRRKSEEKKSSVDIKDEFQDFFNNIYKTNETELNDTVRNAEDLGEAK